MKIIKHRPLTEDKEELEELFGRKKKQAALPPENPGINHAWDEHYKMLEGIRKSGVASCLAGMYLRDGTNLSDEELSKIYCSWIMNYDELARYFHWKSDEED